MAAAAERYDAESIAAPAERPRDQVRGVDPVGRAADDAGPAGDGEPLAVGRRQRCCSLATAWFGAGVCGRAAGRAGEAVCASSCSFLSGLVVAATSDRVAPTRARRRWSLLGSPGVSPQVRRRGRAGAVPRMGQPEAEGLRAEHGQRPLRPRRAPGFTGRAASRSSPASAAAIARRSTTSRSAPRIRRSSTSGRSGTSGTGCGAAAATSASRSRSDSATDGTRPRALTRTHVDPSRCCWSRW